MFYDWLADGKEPKLRLTIGLHPLAKNRAESEIHKLKAKLEAYLQAVRIGEIGIDPTSICRCSTFHNRTTKKSKSISSTNSNILCCSWQNNWEK